jgi:GNAT superfamily N-acetyltransferase
MVYLFYKTRVTFQPPPADLEPGLALEVWRPTLGRPVRLGLPLVPFGVWSLYHFLGVFATRDYFLVLIRHRARLVHRTCVFPAHYRFPFMAAQDLQAGGIWTAPPWRGRGLGLAALREVFGRPECRGRTLWYMVREDNPASIRLAEKAGLLRWGRGGRTTRWGRGPLGRYQVTEWPHGQAAAREADPAGFSPGASPPPR